jgi:hypothetical protein
MLIVPGQVSGPRVATSHTPLTPNRLALADGPPVAEVIGGDLDDVMGDCSTMGLYATNLGRRVRMLVTD